MHRLELLQELIPADDAVVAVLEPSRPVEGRGAWCRGVTAESRPSTGQLVVVISGLHKGEREGRTYGLGAICKYPIELTLFKRFLSAAKADDWGSSIRRPYRHL